MKLLLPKGLFFILLSLLLALPVYALDEEEFYSEAMILMDAGTGQVLFDKNMDKIMYPASTTKIMTGMLVMEYCDPADYITVTESAINIGVSGSSHIALVEGERLTVEDAMYALMLPSANDAANVLAEHVAGSQTEFIRLMNAKAKRIGAFNTNFTNAHGLHDDNHFTTVYDMALITRHAMSNPDFMKYFGTGEYTMPTTNKQQEERPFTNQQYMLVDTTQFYNEDIIGGKTGYTGEARHTMSTVATRNGRTLICVVFSSANRYYKFYDTEKLLEFGFNEFREVVIPDTGIDSFVVPVRESGETLGSASFWAEEDYTFLLHNSIPESSIEIAYDYPDIFSPADAMEATVTFRLSPVPTEWGVPDTLGTFTLDAHADFEAVPVSVPAQLEGEGFLESLFLDNTLAVILVSTLIVLILTILLLMLRQYNIARRRRARLARINRRIRSTYYNSR